MTWEKAVALAASLGDDFNFSVGWFALYLLRAARALILLRCVPYGASLTDLLG